jgi:hypothetical protein
MKWISVEDRLPAFGEVVLVQGGVALLRGNGNWYTGMEEPLFTRIINWKVTHWRPLPEPPKENQ